MITRHAWVLIAVCFLCYWNALLCGFVFDDVSAIKDNKDLRPNTPLKNVFFNDFWGTSMAKEHSHKSYRPICVLSFRLNYLIHTLQPLGYHLVNIVLHAIVCVLYFRLCRLFVPAKTASVCSLLFAVHPIHTEAVTGVVGRAELLCSIFFLLAILSYRQSALVRRATQWTHLLKYIFFVSLATFSKEQGITVLGVCFIYDIFVVQQLNLAELSLPPLFQYNNNASKSSSSKSSSPHWLRPLCQRTFLTFLTGVGLLLLRFKVMGSTLPVFTTFDNPASYQNAPVKQLTWSYLLAVNSWLLLSPSDLCCDWTMGTIPLVRTLSDPRNLATISFLVTFFHLGVSGVFGRSSRKNREVIVMALALISLPFLPASNLFFPVGFVVAERILYLPSMGFCLLVAFGFEKLRTSYPHRRPLIHGMLGFLLVTHGVKTFTRNLDWSDELSIFMSGLRVNTGNAKLWNNVGHALEGKMQYDDALKFFRQASHVQPDDIGAHINVGRTFNNLGRFAEAEDAYLTAKNLLPKPVPGQKYTARIAPQHLNVFINLANLISKYPERLEEADQLYRQAISMRSDYVQAYINRGDILIKMNRTKEAQEVYEKALFYENDNADIYYNLGVVYIEQGKPNQALRYFDKALEIEPEHAQALMNSAILMQETGAAEFRPTAYKRLFKVLETLPDSERVFFNLGMLGMDDNDYPNAEKWFKRAVEIKPDFRSALFNLALLLNEQKRALEAIPFLRSLMEHHPDHIKGLILLGDIYTNHIRDLDEAEACYKKITEIDPNHVQGQHNLCVVMVEKGLMEEAERCLKKVLEMAPGEEYVARHLQIVENRIKLMASRKAP